MDVEERLRFYESGGLLATFPIRYGAVAGDDRFDEEHIYLALHSIFIFSG